MKELQSFGLSALEAKIYLVLNSKKEPLTGYQIAKEAEIPRPNVYPALRRLVQRGALLENPGPQALQYIAVSFRTWGANRLRTMAEQVKKLSACLPEPQPSAVTSRASGLDALLSQGRRLIAQSASSLDIGSSVGMITLFEEDLNKARLAGVPQRYLCFDNCPDPGCGLCISPLRISLSNFHQTGWLTMIRDHDEALIATGYPQNITVLLTTMEPIVTSLDMLINLRESVNAPIASSFRPN